MRQKHREGAWPHRPADIVGLQGCEGGDVLLAASSRILLAMLAWQLTSFGVQLSLVTLAQLAQEAMVSLGIQRGI